MSVYAKMGKFEISGIANGGGHSCLIHEPAGAAIPPRRRVVEIDMAKVEELQEWGEELRRKFEQASSQGR